MRRSLDGRKNGVIRRGTWFVLLASGCSAAAQAGDGTGAPTHEDAGAPTHVAPHGVADASNAKDGALGHSTDATDGVDAADSGNANDAPGAPDASHAPLGEAGPTPTSLALPGVNIDGGEYNLGVSGAMLNTGYVYPSNEEIDYYASKGMKVFRLPFDLGRVQPKNNQPLSTTELGYIDPIVQYAATKNMMVLLDPHMFGYMADDSNVGREIGVDPLMPASFFASFWSLMATHYLTQSNVIFGLMNEPHAQTAAQWKAAAVAAVDAIRATGATQRIHVQGTAYTGAYSWVSSGNAAAWQGFTDPNFEYEVHQYLDSDSSGTHVQCASGTGASTLVAFTEWARSQGVKGFLGETGWSTDPSCPPEGSALMGYMSSNTDVWYGYTYWAGGAWLGSYMYSIEPTGLGTSTVTDQPQMSILLQHL